MAYKELPVEKGRKYLPHIWNLFFKPLDEPDFFVEPWRNCELGDCAEFREDEVSFFVLDAELVAFLDGAREGLHLFGAYNQVNVCQMRARGTVSRVDDPAEIARVKKSRRASITKRVGKTVDGLREEEADARRVIIDSGTLFRFSVTSYAHKMYERG